MEIRDMKMDDVNKVTKDKKISMNTLIPFCSPETGKESGLL